METNRGISLTRTKDNIPWKNELVTCYNFFFLPSFLFLIFLQSGDFYKSVVVMPERTRGGKAVREQRITKYLNFVKHGTKNNGSVGLGSLQYPGAVFSQCPNRKYVPVSGVGDHTVPIEDPHDFL
jgi:hypothetical protein